MTETNKFAAYQAHLLDVLYTEHDGSRIVERLHTMWSDDELSAYVASCDPALLEVAAELTRTWAKLTLPA
jgi:hypothetical protein